MSCLKEFVQLGKIRWTFNDSKDSSSAIIDEYDFQIRREVLIPQGIAVVKEAQVSGDENVTIRTVEGKSCRC